MKIPSDKQDKKIDRMKVFESSAKLENLQEWYKWTKEIPAIEFRQGYKVQVIPPMTGAIVRFRLIKGKHSISVYLDCYDMLGLVGEPYWEIYPYDGDVARVYMDDTDELLDRIDEAFKQLEEQE